jgi:hypothetical protein
MRLSLAIAPANFCVVTKFPIDCQPSGMNSGFSAVNELSDRIADLGSDSVPVNLPVRPYVSQKYLALAEGQGLPNLLCYGTESIDYFSPIAITFRRSPDLCSYQPQKPVSCSWTLFVPELGPAASRAMNPGHQPAARENVDVSSKPFSLQGHRHINTGQT